VAAAAHYRTVSVGWLHFWRKKSYSWLAAAEAKKREGCNAICVEEISASM